MKVVKTWEVKGVRIEAPCQRTIKTFMAPDLLDVKDMTLAQAMIDPYSRTDIHTHDDRPEVMYFTSGRGIVHCNGEDIRVEPEVLCYIEPGDVHYVYNDGPETLKFFVVFVPPITSEENYSRALRMQAKEKQENIII